MANFKQQALVNSIRKQLGLVRVEAIMGDADGIVYDTQPGYIRVRYQTSTGNGWPQAVRKPKIPTAYAVGTPVWVGYDDEGELAVLGPRISAQLAAGQSPYANDVQSDPTGNFLDLSRSVVLRCQPTTPPSLFVTVKAWVYVVSGTVGFFPGDGAVDLTSFVPGSTGEHCAVAVFVDTATAAVEVTASTPKSALDPLNFDDIQECLTAAASTSVLSKVWAVPNGATAISDEHDFLDARQWVNVPATGGGGGDVTVPIQRSWFGI